jgi:glycosyltransferase (activator-dependent family)
VRVMFCPYPLRAHLLPVVPLARAFQGAGHEVCVATHAGLVEWGMTATVTASGLPGVLTGTREDLNASHAAKRRGDRLVDNAMDAFALDPLGENRWEQVLTPLVGSLGLYLPDDLAAEQWPMVDKLVSFARAWRPDLVVWDPLCPLAAIAARAVGAAHARLLWGLDHVAWIRARQLEKLAAEGGGDDLFRMWLSPPAERYGLDFTEETLFGQWSIELTPPRMRLPADLTYLPMRRMPFTGGGMVPPWLLEEPERPRVCVTLGTSARVSTDKTGGVGVRELLESIADLDVEVVATLDRTQLEGAGPLPGNVRTADYVPLDQLLPTCSAIVHHGAGGTFALAVAYRVPQVVVPVPKWDEQAFGRYVGQRGAGLVVDRTELGAGALRKALVRVLTEPPFRDGTAALHAEWLATPGPNDTVPVLEELTALHRGRGEARACA